MSRFAPDSTLVTRWPLIQEGLVSGGSVVSLDGQSHIELVRDAPEMGVSGGRIYDALIVRTAFEAGVDVVVTLNERHFASLATDALTVEVPATGRR